MKKYKVIYADPAWTYKVWSKKGEGRSAEHHYPTMSREDIQNMDVQSICDDDCALFLWVTIPCLEEGLELIRKWGFTYKTVAFVWVKRNKTNSKTNFWGMGHWTRSNIELVLLGTKGKPKRVDKGVHQIVETFEAFETETITSVIGRHSEKPIDVRIRIEQLMGEVSRAELFARYKPDTWDAFGNEIEDPIEIPNTKIQMQHYKKVIQQKII